MHRKINDYIKDYNRIINRLYWLLILFILLIPVITIGDKLGLYFDSVFPDYAATQLLNGQKYQEKWFVSWPILTQIYHGSISMWISALVILISGGTSVIQHRLINVIIVLLILIVLDKVLKNLDVSEIVRRIGIIIISALPSVLGIELTQYYIELPGTLLVVLGILVSTCNVKDEYLNSIRLWLVFFLLGISVYSYYNFIFFIPGFLVLALFNSKDYRNTIILVGYGVFPGAMLYLVGYIIMYLSYNSIDKKMAIICEIIMLIYTVISVFLIFFWINKNQINRGYILAGVEILFFFVSIIFIREPLLQNAGTLNIAGHKATIIERIGLVFDCFKNTLNGNLSQNIILAGEVVNKYQNIVLLFEIVFFLICIFMFIMTKKIDYNIIKCTTIIIVYLLCCVPLITRMQGQHFVPLIFFTSSLLILEINYIIKSSKDNNTIKCIVVGLMIILFFISLIDRYIFVNKIITTGGKNYYTCEINDLAYDALENLDNGEKEIYIFPEWGFMAPFNYITNNNIAFSTDYSENKIKLFIDEGYEVNIVFWRAEDKSYYLDILRNIDIDDIKEIYYKGYDNNSSFYKIEGVVK